MPVLYVYSQGIFTVLEYSSQVAPKVFDSSASSAGANILDPMYRMMPITAPSHAESVAALLLRCRIRNSSRTS